MTALRLATPVSAFGRPPEQTAPISGYRPSGAYPSDAALAKARKPVEQNSGFLSSAKKLIAANWQPMLAGAVAGGAVRLGLKALFAAAAIQVTVPVAAALPVAALSIAVAGMAGGAAAQVARAYWKGERQQGWLKQAVKRGAISGLAGGAIGAAAMHFLPVDAISGFLRNHLSSPADIFLPAAAHAETLTAAVEHAGPLADAPAVRPVSYQTVAYPRDGILPPPPENPIISAPPRNIFVPPHDMFDQDLMRQNFNRLPAHLRALATHADATNDTRQWMHFLKEASFWAINQSHDPDMHKFGAYMIEKGSAIADSHHWTDINSRMIHRDMAYLEHNGLYGIAHNQVAANHYAELAGRIGDPFRQALPTPPVYSSPLPRADMPSPA